MILAAIEWRAVLGTTPLEIIATLSSVAGVILIARQNQLGWLLGIFWALISAWLAFTKWNLISDFILYISYVPIQIYCWWSWQRGTDAGVQVKPTWLPRASRWMLLVLAASMIVVWGFGIRFLSDHLAWIPAPAMLWRDSASTVLNYYSQFLQARKRMENWLGWLVVNGLGIHIYSSLDSKIYVIQYGFFLLLGIYGWWSWHQAMKGKLPC